MYYVSNITAWKYWHLPKTCIGHRHSTDEGVDLVTFTIVAEATYRLHVQAKLGKRHRSSLGRSKHSLILSRVMTTFCSLFSAIPAARHGVTESPCLLY